MLGAVLIAIVVVIVLPVAFMMTAGLLGFAAGWTLTNEAEASHEGSELIELNA